MDDLFFPLFIDKWIIFLHFTDQSSVITNSHHILLFLFILDWKPRKLKGGNWKKLSSKIFCQMKDGRNFWKNWNFRTLFSHWIESFWIMEMIWMKRKSSNLFFGTKFRLTEVDCQFSQTCKVFEKITIFHLSTSEVLSNGCCC